MHGFFKLQYLLRTNQNKVWQHTFLHYLVTCKLQRANITEQHYYSKAKLIIFHKCILNPTHWGGREAIKHIKLNIRYTKNIVAVYIAMCRTRFNDSLTKIDKWLVGGVHHFEQNYHLSLLLKIPVKCIIYYYFHISLKTRYSSWRLFWTPRTSKYCLERVNVFRFRRSTSYQCATLSKLGVLLWRHKFDKHCKNFETIDQHKRSFEHLQAYGL